LTKEKGIFFAPELYISFCIGKDITKSCYNIFDTSVEWLRETNFGNGGPTDIIFKTADTYVLIELKLRDTIEAYKADIEKLRRLNIASEKFFCVLLDSFTPSNDDRLNKLEKEYSNNLILIGHHVFPTWNNWYKKQIFCNLNLYSITHL
jgi:hypothetical protein